MTLRWPTLALLLATLLALAACTRFSGKPAPGPEVPRPDSVLDPVVLYGQNCAGCHGADGRKGPAMDLSDPVYLAIVDDDTLRSTISKGRPGTAMSAFAQKEGGMLTDEQVSSIIHGIRIPPRKLATRNRVKRFTPRSVPLATAPATRVERKRVRSRTAHISA